MIIIHKIGSFLEDLFPELKGNLKNEKLIVDTFADYYSYENIKPFVKVENETVEIHIDTKKILNLNSDFKQASNYCQNGNFKEAIPILKTLIERNPTNSEYYRTLGQAYSMTGDDEEGINYLIDALKWNPKNNYALIMIGNIFARNKNDIETAQKYYQQVIENDPNDAIAINNLGTNLLQVGKIDEGMDYLLKANAINPDYPNSLYGIGFVNQIKGNNQEAFNYAVKCLKKCGKPEQELDKRAQQLMIETAQAIIKTDTGNKIFEDYRKKLQEKSKREIKVVIDNSLETAASFELAENYKRSYHLIKYNQKYPVVSHLMMHELVHLEYILDAREAKCNKLFVSNQTNSKLFIDDLRQHSQKLKKLGLPEESITNTYNSLFKGINRQIFNTPIDLFIEDKLFDEFQDLRPYPFLSLNAIVSEGIKATTDKGVLKYMPQTVLQQSKALNLVNALQFKDLFGMDLISSFNPSVIETNMAKKFYEEFYEYRDDRNTGEEYELVENWAKDLKLDKYFSLVDENEYRKDKTFDSIIEKIENDPFDLESNAPKKEKEMLEFQKSQKNIGTNMAVVMFMVDALQYFKELPKAKIKEIAHEIALQGIQGYNPKNNYRLSSIPEKVFTGYQILAYYYVSWKIIAPEMVSELQLPYDEEYELALQIFKDRIL
jgi:tetratricopeptide (TPR) repeat protein